MQYKTVIFTTRQYQNEECSKLSDEIWKSDARWIVRPNVTGYQKGSFYR